MPGMDDDWPLSTGPTAAAAYRTGVAQLLAGRTAAAIAAFAGSVQDDAGFVLGHVALAVARVEASGDTDAGRDDLAAADRGARGISRWERQHVAIVRLVLGGDRSRAAALGREHLAELGDDAVVRFVVTRHCADVDDLVVPYGTTASGAAAPRANASA
jgi:hypothetical protein